MPSLKILKTSLPLIFLLVPLLFTFTHSHSHGDGGCGHSHMSAEEADNLRSEGLDEFGNAWVVAKAPPRKKTLEDTIAIWWSALGSTVLISAAPFVILFFVPLDNGEEYQPTLKVLLAFAAGGLLGDAFLHLMPHSIPDTGSDSGHNHAHSHGDGGHGHSHNPAYINCNTWVLAGLMTFLIIEKWARCMGVGHSHDGGHGHSHAVSGEKAKNSDAEESEDETSSSKESSGDKSKAAEKSDVVAEEESFLPKMEVAGYLNLAADFSHNFTDGLAIGASYLAGNTVGLITTLTILIHEVPHEIGDFAILIQSGCPRMTAIWLQSSTAIGALAGCILGLSMEAIGQQAINAILPFTAGGFIYIACVSVLPELLNSKYNSAGQVFKEMTALLTGIGLMILIGIIE